MRGLIIQRYKETLDRMNEYWKGWGDKDDMIKPYPDFDSMTDKDLLDKFCEFLISTSLPMG